MAVLENGTWLLVNASLSTRGILLVSKSKGFLKSSFLTHRTIMPMLRLMIVENNIVSCSYDGTVKAWVLDTSAIPEGFEQTSCIRTFKGTNDTDVIVISFFDS